MKQVNDFLEKGLIKRIHNPCAVPSLLTPKKDRKLRFCTNRRAIKKISIRYKFLMPRIEDLLNQLGGASYFTNINLKLGYHQIRIKPEDEWKKGLKVIGDLFEWLVMSFGLSNATSTFMRLVNEIFIDFIGKFVVVYLYTNI